MNSLKYLSHRATPYLKHPRGSTLPRECHPNCSARHTTPSTIWSLLASPISFLTEPHSMPNDLQDAQWLACPRRHGCFMIHFFIMSGAPFLPITPPTPIPLFTQFLRYSSSQEDVLTALWPQTPTFSSIHYTCLHHSCCNSLLLLFALCLSLHLDYKFHEGRYSVIYYIILYIMVLYIILFLDMTRGWHLHKYWLTDTLRYGSVCFTGHKNARNLRMLDMTCHLGWQMLLVILCFLWLRPHCMITQIKVDECFQTLKKNVL